MRRTLAIVLLALAAACATTESSEFEALMQRGEAQYAAGQYQQAFDTFNAAAKTVQGKDDARFIEAAEHSSDAFCMLNFANGRRDLAAGDTLLAFMSIDTALGSPECRKFTDEVKWASEQRAARDNAPRDLR